MRSNEQRTKQPRIDRSSCSSNLTAMNKDQIACVYIMTNTRHSVLYTGVTNDLFRRVSEHNSKRLAGFTKKYKLGTLVYFEATDRIEDAISREKQIKAGSRKDKIELIRNANPHWEDLFDALFVEGTVGLDDETL